MGVRDLEVRRAERGDLAGIAGLVRQLGYELDLDVVARNLAQLIEGDCVFVAEVDGECVGCLTTSQMQVLHRPVPVGRISMMVVDEARRSQGIGAELVRAAERDLAEKGCEIMELTSRLDREDAHRFYAGLGYDRTSIRMARDL